MCLHTDDCCIFALDPVTIDNLLESLTSEFILKDEGSTEDFLGVKISKKACKHSQEIHLQQSGPIQDTIRDLNLDGPSNTHFFDPRFKRGANA